MSCDFHVSSSIPHPLIQAKAPRLFRGPWHGMIKLTDSSDSGGYIISAIFICAEYQRLGIHHREHRHLRISFWIKLAFIFVELGLAIAFGVLGDKDHYNSAAVVEWVIALIYTFYVWSFAIDFIPAVTHKNGFESGGVGVGVATAMEEESRARGYPGEMQQEQHTYSNANGYTNVVNGGNGYKPEPVAPSRNF